MSDWLINKYIGMLSPRLEKFKRKGPTLYNFRCPICHDSQVNKNKARAYIYEKEGKMLFHCHNCEATMLAQTFIKTIDQNLYDEYCVERIRDEKPLAQVELEQFVNKMKKPVFLKSGPLKGLKKVSQLSPNNAIKQFVDSRKIPNPYHAKLFAAPNFKSFVNSLIPDKYSKESLLRDETRLLIPYFDRDKNVFAFNARAIGNSNVKYLKTVLNEDVPNVFGLDTVDFHKPVYVFEGEIDSMFINNALATGGGDLVAAVKGLDKTNMTIVLDNEPRSRETINKLDKAINNGYSIVVWPENLEHKDVNDMILHGMSPDFIHYILKANTFKDLHAKLALTKWSKV